MSEKNLPIKVIMQRATDTQKNLPGGTVKFFGEVTPELTQNIIGKFEELKEFYSDLFDENALVPAVGKITVKPEAIAKSHKPNDLCRNCPIIGGDDLDEIYIKVSKKGIQDTIELVKNPPSQKFKANMTAITDIKPVIAEQKISKEIMKIQSDGDFGKIKGNIKVKFFDFDDEFDNNQVRAHINRKLEELGLLEKSSMVSYGERIKFLKVVVESYEEIEKIAAINGVKSIDFFQKYSLPLEEYNSSKIEEYLEKKHENSDIQIGIIDGGYKRE